MSKKLLFIVEIFLLLFFCVIVSFADNEDKVITINKDMFKNVVWGPEGDFGSSIEFKDGGKYTAGFHGESGDVPTNGSYKIENNILVLTPKFGKDQKSLYFQQETWRMICKESNSSLKYTQYLTFENSIKGEKYWNHSSIVRDVVRNINGIDVIMINKNGNVSKPNVFLRKKPSTSAEKIMVKFPIDSEEETKHEYFLPIDYKFEVIGRTSIKDKVGDMENYWYYCHLGVDDGWYVRGDCIQEGSKQQVSDSVWIYGAFIEIK